MLIASKFHDYLDVASKYGVDKTVVFERGGEVIETKEFSELMPPHEKVRARVGRREYTFTFYKLIVGFCGHLHPLMHVKRSLYPISDPPSADEYLNFYDKDEFLSFLEENKINYSKDRRYRLWQSKNLYIDSVHDIDRFFEQMYWRDLFPLFRKLHAPTFVVGKDYVETESRGRSHAMVTKNPQLKKYKFMKVKDPITAFQDIFMFISGVLGIPERPMVKLSDKEMAKKRGHDSKYSFKKMPRRNK